jgi:hypothetical protein
VRARPRYLLPQSLPVDEVVIVVIHRNHSGLRSIAMRRGLRPWARELYWYWYFQQVPYCSQGDGRICSAERWLGRTFGAAHLRSVCAKPMIRTPRSGGVRAFRPAFGRVYSVSYGKSGQS